MTRAPEITDHALLRYIERAHGVDVEALRKLVADIPQLRAAVAIKARSVSVDGLTYRLSEDGRVVTVQPHQSPQSAFREAHRVKYGRSAKMRGAQNSHNRVHKAGTARREDRRPLPEADYSDGEFA